VRSSFRDEDTSAEEDDSDDKAGDAETKPLVFHGSNVKAIQKKAI
jgi:hypothetical protein